MPTTFSIHYRSGTYQLPLTDVTLEADSARLQRGDVRCSLAIWQGTAVLWRDTANLGTVNGRAKVRDAVAGRADVTDEALLALEEAIRDRLKSAPPSNGRVVQFPTTLPPNPLTQASKTLADVHETFQNWLYLPDTSALDLALATVVANHGQADPVWLLIVDAPGGGKTEVINALSSLPYMHSMSDFTEAGLLSGTSEKERAETATGGLLRQIGEFGILTIRDFGAILAMQQDIRGKILQDLREMYDGHWKRNVGTDGGQALEWQGKIGLIGAATPAIDEHHSVLASLGERFIFYRPLPSEETKREMARQALMDIGKEVRMRAELQAAVAGLFTSLDLKQPIPDLQGDQTEYLITLATLTVHCRSAVERDRIKREVQEVPEGEYPTRLVKVLRLLYHGLTTIGVESGGAWNLVKQVALSSMPRSRRRVLEHLVSERDWRTTARIATQLDYPTTSIKRALEDLTAHQVAKRSKVGSSDTDQWVLSDLARQLWAALEAQPANPIGGARTQEQGGRESIEQSMQTPIGFAGLGPVTVGDWVIPLTGDGQMLFADPSPVFEVRDDYCLLLDTGAAPGDASKGGRWFWWPVRQCEVVLRAAAVPWPDGESVETAIPARPAEACRICGNTETWWQPSGGWVCTVCVPQAREVP